MIQKRKKILITKFTEYRKFNVNWTKRDPDGRINYRDKYHNDVILPMALKSKIVYEVDNGRSISFTDAFTSFMTEASKNRKSINPKLQSDQLFVEYYTTSEVAKYLGLTYENYYDVITKDPKYFKENI